MDYDTFRAKYLETGRWLEGESASRDAVARGTGDASAWLQLGVVLAHLDCKREAREVLTRAVVAEPDSPRSRWWLGRLLDEAGDFPGAAGHYAAALAADPGHEPSRHAATFNAAARRECERAAAHLRDFGAIDADGGPRFLVIRSWGAGFWSEILHLLGGLLTAELTQRIPVVAWGGNCRFRDAGSDDAFADFFEPVSAVRLDDLPIRAGALFPPKWRPDNLTQPEVAKRDGPWSRMSAAQFIGRPEPVAVYDHFNSTHLLARWIPAGHPWHGLDTLTLNRRILEKYLRPRREFADRAGDHIARLFGGEPFDAFHLRGTDKVLEMPLLDAVNAHALDRLRAAAAQGHRLFVLTDAEPLLSRAQSVAGPRLSQLECRRGLGDIGVHFERNTSPRRLGEEVLVDVLVARHARSFLGNGWSGVSCGVRTLSSAQPDAVRLTGPFDMALDHYGEYLL